MNATNFSRITHGAPLAVTESLAVMKTTPSTTYVLPATAYSVFLLNPYDPIKRPNSRPPQQLFATMPTEDVTIDMVAVVTITVTASVEEATTNFRKPSLTSLLISTEIRELIVPSPVPATTVGIPIANIPPPVPVQPPRQSTSILSSSTASTNTNTKALMTSDILLVTDSRPSPTPKVISSAPLPPPIVRTSNDFIQPSNTPAQDKEMANENRTVISPLTIIGMATGATIAVFVSITLIVIYLIRRRQLRKGRRSSKSSSDLTSDGSRGLKSKIKWPMLRQKSWCEEKIVPTEHICGGFIRYSAPCEKNGMKCGFPNSEEELAALRTQLGHGRDRSISSMNLIQQLPYPQRHPPPPKRPPPPPPRRPPRPAPLSLSEIPGPLTLPPIVGKRKTPKKPRVESKQVTWQDQLFQDQSFVYLPPIHKPSRLRTLPSIASEEVEQSETSEVDREGSMELPSAKSRNDLARPKPPEAVFDFFASPNYRSYCTSMSTLAIEGVNRPYSALSTSSRAVSPISHTVALSPPPAHHQCSSPGRLSQSNYLRRSQVASSLYNSIILDSNPGCCSLPHNSYYKQIYRQNSTVDRQSRYHKKTSSGDRSSNRHCSIINGSLSTESYLPLGRTSPSLHWDHTLPLSETRICNSRAYHGDAESNSNATSFAYPSSAGTAGNEKEQVQFVSNLSSKLNYNHDPRIITDRQKEHQNRSSLETSQPNATVVLEGKNVRNGDKLSHAHGTFSALGSANQNHDERGKSFNILASTSSIEGSPLQSTAQLGAQSQNNTGANANDNDSTQSRNISNHPQNTPLFLISSIGKGKLKDSGNRKSIMNTHSSHTHHALPNVEGEGLNAHASATPVPDRNKPTTNSARSESAGVCLTRDSVASISSTGSSILFLNEVSLGKNMKVSGKVEPQQSIGQGRDRVCISSLGHRCYHAIGGVDQHINDDRRQPQPRFGSINLEQEKREHTDSELDDNEATPTPKTNSSVTFRFPNIPKCHKENPMKGFVLHSPTSSSSLANSKTNPSSSNLTLPLQHLNILTPTPEPSQNSNNTTLPPASSLCADTYTYTTSSSRCSTHFDTGTSSEEDSFRLMKDLERVSIMEASRASTSVEVIEDSTATSTARDNRDTSYTEMMQSPPREFKFMSILKPKPEGDGQEDGEGTRQSEEEEMSVGCLMDFERGLCKTIYSPTMSMVNFYGGLGFASLNDMESEGPKNELESSCNQGEKSIQGKKKDETENMI